MSVRPPAYRLNPLAGLVWSRGWATITDGQIRLDLANAVKYELREEEARAAELKPPRSPLFDLAAVDSSDAAWHFARQWGFLWTGPDAERYDEPLSAWLKHAEQLRFILRLCVALRQSAESRSRKHTTALRKMIGPWIEEVRAQGPTDAVMIETLDVERQVAVWICELINPILGEVREGLFPDGRLEYGGAGNSWVRGDPTVFHFSPNVSSLLAYVYHRLAQTIGANITLFECEWCGTVVQRSHGNQRFCGERCGRASRNRTHRARKLRST